MKPLVIKTSSLHYRLATVYSDYESFRDAKDICHYIRKCVRGLFNILIFLLLAGFVFGGSLIHVVLGIYFAVFHDLPFEVTLPMLPVLGSTAVVLCILILFVGFTAIGYLYQKATTTVTTTVRKAAAREAPPFYVNAYRSIKQKTCVKIVMDYDQ